MVQTETVVQNSDPCMKRNKVSPSLFQLLLREHVQAVAQDRGTKQARRFPELRQQGFVRAVEGSATRLQLSVDHHIDMKTLPRLRKELVV